MDDIVYLNCVAYDNLMGNYYLDLEGECKFLSFEAVCEFVEMQKYPVAIMWGIDQSMNDYLVKKLFMDVRSRPDLFQIAPV